MQVSDNFARNISRLVWLIAGVSLLLIATSIALARGRAAQEQAKFMPGPTRLVRLDPQPNQRYVPPPTGYYQSLVVPNAPKSANIVVNFIGGGWTNEAETAFEFAAGIWETLITSSVPIVVTAQFGPLDPDVLGKAGASTVTRDFVNAPQPNTWYPIATANKLAGFDLAENVDDIDATFSSTFSDWYFGTDGATPIDKADFVSVVLHELGHGLGFFGSMRVDDGAGSDECTGVAGQACHGFGPEAYSMIYDRFTEVGDGSALLSFPNNSTELANQLTSDNIYFDSPGVNDANGGPRVPLYAPPTWLPASSYAHLAESYNSTNHALMTFSIALGEHVHNPGAITLCMFNDMGWSVSESCLISGLAAENSSPNSLGITTYLSATITAGSNVTYTWAYGDGEFGSGWQTDHLYGAVGPYTAVVTATNSINMVTATTQVDITLAKVYIPMTASENQ